MQTNIWYLLGLGIFLSYVSAQERGVPWFSWGGQRQTTRSHSPKRLRTKSIKPKSPYLAKQTATTAQHPAFERLHSLTHNEELAHRLIARLKERNPHRNIGWCIEKAIYDIERDRMVG